MTSIMEENWRFIVNQYLRNACADAHSVRITWNDIFREILGYSKLRGEIDIKRTVGNRELSGVVVRKNGKDAFLVMCKKYTEDFKKEDEAKLIEELKMIEVPFGIFVCSEIYACLYVNGKLLKMQIKFLEENEKGVEFLEVFERNNFDREKAINFILDDVINSDVDDIVSEVTVDFVFDLMWEYFSDRYDDKTIEQAFGKLRIAVDIINDPDPAPDLITDDDMSKMKAISLFREKGHIIKRTAVTYASQNASTDIYWANPPIHMLKVDWILILNDKKSRKLYLIKIPANTFKASDFKVRNDQRDKIDLQIAYGDPNFTDRRSGVRFSRFMKDSIS